ncbi:MAG: CARDB domain-containing protein, partial [Planctomycetota bacterium]
MTNAAAPAVRAAVAPVLESLEQRRLLASFAFEDGGITVTATEAADVASAKDFGSSVRVTVNGVNRYFGKGAIPNGLRFDMLGGNDSVDASETDLPTLQRGGAGDDTLTGGTGLDTLDGGVGFDVGRGGETLISIEDDGSGGGGSEPDLLATSLDLLPAGDLVAGETIDFAFAISNAGDADAAGSVVGLYLSTDTQISTGDLRLGSASLAMLAAGESSGLLQQAVTLPAENDIYADGDGVYYFGLIVDVADSVNESDETNNANQGDGIDVSARAITGTSTGGGSGGGGPTGIFYEDAGITVNGTSDADTVTAQDFGGNIRVQLNDTVRWFGKSAIPNGLRFNMGGGDDSIDASLTDLTTVQRGGEGDDTLLGGTGTDTLDGGDGFDIGRDGETLISIEDDGSGGGGPSVELEGRTLVVIGSDGDDVIVISADANTGQTAVDFNGDVTIFTTSDFDRITG